MRILYTILLYFATPFILMRLLIKSRHNSAYRLHWKQRFGHIPLIENKKTLWLHAVSLGESIAAAPLIEKILATYPERTLVVTNTTPTGRALIEKRFGSRLINYYTPYDLPHVIRRFLTRLQPTQVLLMETELWPNLLAALKKRAIPTLIVNARLSERSMRKYRYFQSVFKPLLQPLKISAQSKKDATHFLMLGAQEKNILINGNLKFDYESNAEVSQRGKILRQHWLERPTLITASTHEGEEKIILHAFEKIRRSISNALLILVPRHPERFAKVAELCQTQGFSIAKRSQQEIPTAQTAIYFGDTMGELLLLYAASDVAFVGGSLIPIGGHNLIEPASLSLPILSGPNLQNFTAVRDLLLEENALHIVENADALAQTVLQLFTDIDQRQQFGIRALAVSQQNRGAMSRTLELIS